MSNLVNASIKRLRTSSQKLNLVTAMIRNMNVSEALVQLEFSPKRIADDVKKCLQSAIANAENNMGLNIDNLVVKSATVGRSIVMKRMRARARGRSARIQKPFSNLYITLSEREEN
ncbi:50S ribosomal protein L22 [Rickettsiaceae bacterium]|nr:50S ribosomal protein L22 [Rickettsiaceae bacterium]